MPIYPKETRDEITKWLDHFLKIVAVLAFAGALVAAVINYFVALGFVLSASIALTGVSVGASIILINKLNGLTDRPSVLIYPLIFPVLVRFRSGVQLMIGLLMALQLLSVCVLIKLLHGRMDHLVSPSTQGSENLSGVDRILLSIVLAWISIGAFWVLHHRLTVLMFKAVSEAILEPNIVAGLKILQARRTGAVDLPPTDYPVE